MRRAFALATVLGCGTVEPDDPYAPPNTTPTGVASDATDGTATGERGTSGPADSGSGADTTGGCVVGSEGCPCTGGGACDLGLACLSDVCVDPGPLCPVGTQGCPCTAAGSCDGGLACDTNQCVPAG